MLTLIGIFIFVLSQFIYDYTGMGHNTNWQIFYFSTTYLSFVLVSFDLICKEYSKAIQYTAGSMILYFIFLIGLELYFINEPFDVYILGVNSTNINITAMVLLSFILIFLTLRLWEKRHWKK